MVPLALEQMKKNYWLILIAVVAFGVYANTLSHEFVWDDVFVFNSPWLRESGHLKDILISNSLSWTDAKQQFLYRPLGGLFIKSLYSIIGYDPYGYHLVGVLLHVASSMGVFLICRRLFDGMYQNSEFVAAVAALLFAVHPAHTEAVSWISASGDIMMSLFSLIALFFYMKKEKRQLIFSALSAAFLVIALLFKETALTIPVLMVSYDIAFRRGLFIQRDLRGSTGTRIAPYIFIGGALALYLGLRSAVLPEMLPGKTVEGLDLQSVFLNIFPLLRQYLFLLIFPVNLNALHVFSPVKSIAESSFLSGILIGVLFFVLLLGAWRKNRILFYGMISIVIPLVPAFYLPALNFFYKFAERYLYLSSVGFAIAFGAMLGVLMEGAAGRPAYRKVSVLLVVVLLVLLSTATFYRNEVWQNNLTLWSDTAAKSPDSPVARNNLGSEYLRMGWLHDAQREFEAAVALSPTYPDANKNLWFVKKIIEQHERGSINPEDH